MDADKSDEPPSRQERQVRGLGKQWFFSSLYRLPKVLSFSRTEILTTDPTSPRLRRTGGTEFTELRCGNEFYERTFGKWSKNPQSTIHNHQSSILLFLTPGSSSFPLAI
jgi:hypothetical protein